MMTRGRFRFVALSAVFVAGLGLAETCLCEQPAVNSQPYTWKNVKVVAGGFIPGIIYSTKQPGLMYCRTDIGSAYKYDNVAKKWIPMTDWCGLSNYMGSESIAADPLDANRVYIAAGMYSRDPSAIMRSMDQGKTFQVVEVPIKMGGNENGRGVGERLAIDPNFNDILYFGSRHDGLWRSTDAALTWKKVESFPIQGGAAGTSTPPAPPPATPSPTAPATPGATPGPPFPPGGRRPSSAGLSFVVFDPDTGSPGVPTRNIYVGSTDPGDVHLYRRTDAGKTWEPVPGQPKDLVPIHAQFDTAGMLYLVYDNGVGPNNVTVGAVWKYNTKDGAWTDITPDKAPDRLPGGYGGLAVDRQHPGTLAVATLNHWKPIDDVYHTTDGGNTWKSISAKAERDASLSPYLIWGDPQPRLGWWMAALAMDPFDSNRVCYGTGATIWGTDDFANVDSDQPTHWTVWADGIEETAILDLISPTEGAHLISGFGDIGGFTHDDLDVSPPNGMHSNPIFTNTNTVDYAEKNPSIIVREGTPHNREGTPPGATMAYSEDGGHTWKPISLGQPPSGGRGGFGGFRGAALTLNADGSVFMSLSGTPSISKDRGQTWTPCQGLPQGVRPVADRVNPNKFYAIDIKNNKIYTSTDEGATFAESDCKGIPAGPEENPAEMGRGLFGMPGPRLKLRSTFGKEDDLWLYGRSGLCRSIDGGDTFAQVPSVSKVFVLGFGKAAPGKDYPAVYLAGTIGGIEGVFRSDDAGSTWLRITDDQHQYGNRFHCITGDPRIYGRVYVGTDGRGILYGDIAQ